MTTARTSKTSEARRVPQEYEGRVEQVSGAVDPELVTGDRLFILDGSGQMVPVNADPAAFDAAISAYVALYDRASWPPYHRADLLTNFSRNIPVFRLKAEM